MFGYANIKPLIVGIFAAAHVDEGCGIQQSASVEVSMPRGQPAKGFRSLLGKRRF